MKIMALIQARMGSERMPGKIMKKIMGKPILSLILERVRRTRRLLDVAVLTTNVAADDVLVAWAEREKIALFRGHETDVLHRFYEASNLFLPDIIVRLTGDNPFYDWDLADVMIENFLSQPCDYLSNGIEPTFPIGIGAEILTRECLNSAWKEALTPYDREHVTPYIYRHPEKFHIKNFAYKENLSAYRLTMDTPEDYELTREIYEALYPQKPYFALPDILDFFKKRPDLTRVRS